MDPRFSINWLRVRADHLNPGFEQLSLLPETLTGMASMWVDEAATDRRTIKDRQDRTVGFVDTMPDGVLKAMDIDLRVVGYYDPKKDVTVDGRLRRISDGDTLSSLIGEA